MYEGNFHRKIFFSQSKIPRYYRMTSPCDQDCEHCLFTYKTLSWAAEEAETAGDYARAQQLYHKMLAAQVQEVGVDDLSLIGVYYRLANVYKLQKEYTLALANFTKVLEILQDYLGEHDLELATPFNHIGHMYLLMNDRARAIVFFLREVSIIQASLGEHHRSLQEAYENLSELYAAEGDDINSVDYSCQALKIHILDRQAELGDDYHYSLMELYEDIGFLYALQSDFQQAIDYFSMQLLIQEQRFGANHPSVALTYKEIANCHNFMGEHELALMNYGKVVEIQQLSLSAKKVDPVTMQETLSEIHLIYEQLNITFKPGVSRLRN
jgi:tetratricopeptide (TPR) repeat protein